MTDILKKIGILAIILFGIVILWRVLIYVLPVLLVLYALYLLFGDRIQKKEQKWYEGSETDSYYQKQKRDDHDVIDVEVKVRHSDDDTADR